MAKSAATHQLRQHPSSFDERVGNIPSPEDTETSLGTRFAFSANWQDQILSRTSHFLQQDPAVFALAKKCMTQAGRSIYQIGIASDSLVREMLHQLLDGIKFRGPRFFTAYQGIQGSDLSSFLFHFSGAWQAPPQRHWDWEG